MTDPYNIESIYELAIQENSALTDKQKLILGAAVEMFSVKGFSATSTSEIAKKAGVAEGTIFRHYKTKKELLISIVQPIMSEMAASVIIHDVKKVMHKDYESFEDFIRTFLLNRQTFFRKNLPIVKIMLQEIPFHPDLRNQFKDTFFNKVFPHIKEVIEHYQNQGEIQPLPIQTILRLIFSSIAGLMYTRYIIAPEVNWDDGEEVERTVHFVMNGIGTNKS